MHRLIEKLRESKMDSKNATPRNEATSKDSEKSAGRKGVTSMSAGAGKGKSSGKKSSPAKGGGGDDTVDGKKGKWRTTGSGQKVFIPNDGSTPKGDPHALKAMKKKESVELEEADFKKSAEALLQKSLSRHGEQGQWGFGYRAYLRAVIQGGTGGHLTKIKGPQGKGAAEAMKDLALGPSSVKGTPWKESVEELEEGVVRISFPSGKSISPNYKPGVQDPPEVVKAAKAALKASGGKGIRVLYGQEGGKRVVTLKPVGGDEVFATADDGTFFTRVGQAIGLKSGPSPKKDERTFIPESVEELEEAAGTMMTVRGEITHKEPLHSSQEYEVKGEDGKEYVLRIPFARGDHPMFGDTVELRGRVTYEPTWGDQGINLFSTRVKWKILKPGLLRKQHADQLAR